MRKILDDGGSGVAEAEEGAEVAAESIVHEHRSSPVEIRSGTDEEAGAGVAADRAGIDSGVHGEGEVSAISTHGSADAVEGATGLGDEGAIDAVVFHLPILKAVSPVSGAGPDAVGCGVPVRGKGAVRKSRGVVVEADVVDVALKRVS